MTFQKINASDTHMQQAFSSTERPYLQCLINRCNHMLALILTNQATKENRLEYHSLKWAIKELGGVEKENLQKVSRE